MVRKDDDASVLEKRLLKFETATLPIVEYYKKKGLLWEVDADGEK